MSCYAQEIKAMLYALGDSKSPKLSTCKLLQNIIKNTLLSLIHRASKIKNIRRGKLLTVEDFCFVLRKNPNKVKRVLSSITFKELRKKINDDIDEIELNEEEFVFDWMVDRNVKYFEYEEVESSDEYLERLQRIDELTTKMSINEYLEFTECRQASFTYRKQKKFKEFLGIEEKLKDDVVDILGFIAYEILCTIVEEGIKIKKSRRNVSNVEKGLFGEDESDGINEDEVKEACRQIMAERGSLYI